MQARLQHRHNAVNIRVVEYRTLQEPTQHVDTGGLSGTLHTRASDQTPAINQKYNYQPTRCARFELQAPACERVHRCFVCRSGVYCDGTPIPLSHLGWWISLPTMSRNISVHHLLFDTNIMAASEKKPCKTPCRTPCCPCGHTSQSIPSSCLSQVHFTWTSSHATSQVTF